MNEAARSEYFATAEARTNVMISLISTLASDYFQLLALDREMEIARDSTNSFSQSLKIFSNAGTVAFPPAWKRPLEAEEASAAAQVPELETAEDRAGGKSDQHFAGAESRPNCARPKIT